MFALGRFFVSLPGPAATKEVKYEKREYRKAPPSCVVILTDGYGYFPRKEDTMDIPVLWLINNLDVTPPFGRTLRFGREVIANSRKRRKH